MRIAVNAVYLITSERATGFGRYLENLLGALEKTGCPHEFVLFSPEVLPADMPFSYPVKILPVRVPRARFADVMVLSEAFRREKFDGLFLPHFEYPRKFPAGVKTLLTIHDLIPTLFLKPEFLFKGKTPPAMISLTGYLDLFRYRTVLPKVHRLVTVSQTSLQDLKRLAPVEYHPKFRAVRNGVDPLFRIVRQAETERVLHSFDLEYKKYLFYFGGHTVRKNLGRIAEAWSSLPRERREQYPLVVIGDGYWKKQIQAFGRGRRIRFLPKVPQEYLVALVAGAAFTLYPSLYEGFGFPVVESLRCGTLPLCGDIPTNREILGDKAAYFNPYQVSDMVRLMKKALVDGPGDPEQVSRIIDLEQFSWKESAKTWSDLWEERDA